MDQAPLTRKPTRKKTAKKKDNEGPVGDLPVGFDAADEDSDSKELREYLDARLNDESFRHSKVFKKLDQNGNGSISKEEFSKRHEVIAGVMGPNYFDQLAGPVDPGTGYAPFRGLSEAVDDAKTLGTVFHRYQDLLNDEESEWTRVNLKEIPSALDSPFVQSKLNQKSTVEDLVNATVIVAGGGGGMNFFTGGAVIISPDGLAVTNYHIVEDFNSKMIAMTPDGKAHRVVELLAGDYDRDVALIRIEGNNFPFVKIADSTPEMGSNLVLMHHSENRFYTYDRGYVMRYPRAGKVNWMEISADYAPGGSGCGIFNSNHELVGLVSMIQYGDGPTIAEGMDFADGQSKKSLRQDDDFGPGEGGILLVKHAVTLSSIKSLWTTTNNSRRQSLSHGSADGKTNANSN